jgi:hypothetical protein
VLQSRRFFGKIDDSNAVTDLDEQAAGQDENNNGPAIEPGMLTAM